MKKSPCIGCEFEFADKNNPTCRECDRRVEYVALIEGGGSIMGELKKSEVAETKEICVICHDKNKPILNKRSKTCPACYQAWRQGTKDHPTLGKFTLSQVHHRSKITKTKDQKSKARDQKIEEILGRDGPIVTLNLDDYPKIKRQVNYLSERYFVPQEHAIIGLLGEALAARKERSDHE